MKSNQFLGNTQLDMEIISGNKDVESYTFTLIIKAKNMNLFTTLNKYYQFSFPESALGTVI